MSTPACMGHESILALNFIIRMTTRLLLLCLFLLALGAGLIYWMGHIAHQSITDKIHEANLPTTALGWHERVVEPVDFVNDGGRTLRQVLSNWNLPADLNTDKLFYINEQTPDHSINLRDPAINGHVDTWRELETSQHPDFLQLDKALSAPTLTYRLRDDQPLDDEPELAVLRELAQVLLARSLAHEAQGRLDQAISDVIAVLRLANYARSVPDFQALALSNILRYESAQAMQGLIFRHRLTPPMLERLQAALAQTLAQYELSLVMLMVEARVAEFLMASENENQAPRIRRVHTSLGGLASPWMMPGVLSGSEKLQNAEMMTDYLRWHEKLEEHLALAVAMRQMQFQEYPAPDWDQPVAKLHRVILGNHNTSETQFPLLYAHLQESVKTQAALILVNAGIKLELGRYLFRRWPDSWTDLHGKPPIDPYTNETLVIEKRPLGLLVRSVGFDEKLNTEDDLTFQLNAAKW